MNKEDNKVYKLIDLAYIKEVGQGNLDYEREIINVFLETIPQNLDELSITFESGSYQNVKRILHFMQSSISIMGLNDVLDQPINAIIEEDLAHKVVKQEIDKIIHVCNEAMIEAKHYLNSIT